MLKDVVKSAVRAAAPPLVRNRPIESWPGWLGRTLDVKVPAAVIPKAKLSPEGNANINILIHMIARTRALPGDLADCGVFRGGSTVGMGLYLRQHGIAKKIYGFDSFGGFPEEANADIHLGGAANEDRHTHGFDGTSVESVRHKIARFGLQNIELVPGFFHQTFPTLAGRQLSFCFAHLDVNLYDSYKCCLEFFYPRLVPGAVVLFDEYNDPPWPGCNKAVDEFLQGRSERLELCEMNNYQKWYFVKK